MEGKGDGVVHKERKGGAGMCLSHTSESWGQETHTEVENVRDRSLKTYLHKLYRSVVKSKPCTNSFLAIARSSVTITDNSLEGFSYRGLWVPSAVLSLPKSKL
jgi:hypothetical protein